MCLVAIAWKCHPRWRLLMAGNRDEFHDRPAAGLGPWPESETGLRAGRDLQAGGTWAGMDMLGRCAVVTNVRDPLASASTGPSRGQLPVDFLNGRASARQYATALTTSAGAYAPFNLLLVDAESCAYVGNHPQIEQHALARGIHGMSNGGLDVPWPKTQHLCEAMRQWLETTAEDSAPMWAALASEQIAPDETLPHTGVGIELERMLSAAFIRGPRYGTRASTLIAIDYDGHGYISERRFGPDGIFVGETTLRNDR